MGQLFVDNTAADRGGHCTPSNVKKISWPLNMAGAVLWGGSKIQLASPKVASSVSSHGDPQACFAPGCFFLLTSTKLVLL